MVRGNAHGLALKNGGVVAWGCGRFPAGGQCRVPAAALSGVTAIAAGWDYGLALKQNGSVIAWGCGEHGATSAVWRRPGKPAAMPCEWAGWTV